MYQGKDFQLYSWGTWEGLKKGSWEERIGENNPTLMKHEKVTEPKEVKG